MSNSPLVNYIKLSPNKNSPRNHKIDTITIHCMAGNGSVESCGNIFMAPERQASSNYGIGSDGRIGLYVNEADRSWATSSPSNDNRAVTIEVANDTLGPDWHVSDKAMSTLIKLVADICERNDIKALLWKADPKLIGQITEQNMTVHRWFANKECPGPFLFDKMGYIALEVNKLLKAYTHTPITPPVTPTSKPSILYQIRIQTSALNVRKGPGTNYDPIDTLRNDKNVYDVIAEAHGPGATLWCQLSSTKGWVSKDYIAKL